MTTTVITAKRRTQLIDLAEIWRYREVFYFLVWRDLKVRYRQTYLGILWAVLQPLISMSVFSVVFGYLVGVSSGGVPYPLFVICALVPWSFFSRAVLAMTGSLLADQDLVKKIYFPRIAIPTSAMLSCAVDVVTGFVIILAILAIYQTAPAPQIVLAPVLILLTASAALGIGLIMASWNVRFRDVGHIAPFALQTLLFLSPVIYSADVVPGFWRLLYSVNPLVGIIDAMRWCVLGTPADWSMVLISSLASLGFLLLGLATFARSEKAFPDLI